MCRLDYDDELKDVVRLISQLLLSRIKLMRGGAVEPFTVLMVDV